VYNQLLLIKCRGTLDIPLLLDQDQFWARIGSHFNFPSVYNQLLLIKCRGTLDIIFLLDQDQFWGHIVSPFILPAVYNQLLLIKCRGTIDITFYWTRTNFEVISFHHLSFLLCTANNQMSRYTRHKYLLDQDQFWAHIVSPFILHAVYNQLQLIKCRGTTDINFLLNQDQFWAHIVSPFIFPAVYN
jgi:hypothetical protein